MRLIKPSFKIKEQNPGLDGIYKQIEWAGRHCYKSLDKITETSAKEFVDRLIKSGHTSVLEHGTVYLKVPFGELREDNLFENEGTAEKYSWNEYSSINTGGGQDNWYITSNYRVLIENNWLDDLQYICEPTDFHEKRVCVKFICDRGVSHEFVRHRTFSFSQESTRRVTMAA